MTTNSDIVEFAIDTSLGRIRIQAGGTGLTGIMLQAADDAGAFAARPAGPDHSLLAEAARQIREYLAGKRTAFSLPLALLGTPFQLQVWEIIRRIPWGRTMTYGAIAAQLGDRAKARAVGGAAHANPLPLVIPCHRVIGADGSLTGFAFGLSMKERLLELEGRRPKQPYLM